MEEFTEADVQAAVRRATIAGNAVPGQCHAAPVPCRAVPVPCRHLVSCDHVTPRRSSPQRGNRRRRRGEAAACVGLTYGVEERTRGLGCGGWISGVWARKGCSCVCSCDHAMPCRASAVCCAVRLPAVRGYPLGYSGYSLGYPLGYSGYSLGYPLRYSGYSLGYPLGA
jgi:hypothetical protein